ncbi:MAG: response regulator transcription factor [Caldilineaceae bacterium]|nr:response regulator transcription factor [Caldilineaceae bacterium]
MERAVDLASPAAALRPFLDEGGAACHLLRTLSDRPHPPAFTRVLVDAFAETAAPIPAVPASPTGQDTQQANQQLLDPLTERELDVLQHIAKGLTNKEIADHLYVTEGTVKSHAKHIYSKLGVGNRTEAAARARELHLV